MMIDDADCCAASALDFSQYFVYGVSVRFEMDIYSIRHKGLERLIERDDPRGISGDLRNRVRNIVTALLLAPDAASIMGPPGWRIHQLSGDRAGTWSISVSGNWRITFEVEEDEILNLDLEDYH